MYHTLCHVRQLRRLEPHALHQQMCCDGLRRLHRQPATARSECIAPTKSAGATSADACGQRALPGPGPGQEADPCNEKLIINPLFALPLGVGESEGESGCPAPFERMA